MPKRKRDRDSEIEKLNKKFRRLERKLNRAKRRRSSSREDSALSVHSNEATENTTDIFSDDEGNVPRQKLKSAVVNRALSADESPPPARAHSLEQPAAPPRAPMAQLPPATQPPASPLLPPQDTESCPVARPCADADPHTSAVTVSDATMAADDDVVDILGDDPTQTTEFGKDIHVGLVNRLNHIIINGLENDARKELCKKYLIPANCPRMVPPMLNPEIKVAIPEASLKRDKGIENRQKQLATALACLSDVMTTKMKEKDKDSALIKQLMDVAKLMCDSLHSDSTKRRYFALSTLKKDINDHLMQTKIDKYLFGETLAETLKTAKAVSKSGADIKVPYDKNKKTNQPQPSTSRGLNWKAPPPTGRQSGPPRSRQSYPPAAARPGPLGRTPTRRRHRAISRGRPAATRRGPPPRLGLKAASPGDEDCNSNTSLAGSQHSAQDDTHTDNSDYLWFLDYNPLFRDGSCHHTSVLSSVSASYKGIGDLTSRFEFTSRYNDLARDLDANLAEADMESFKTEDIHALLMTDMPHDIVQHNERTHDGDESTAGSINTMSICKSELLFSPVKEPTHGVHFSVDSLDCELPSERELILTCQANKDNYTIAFEGSLIYDDEPDQLELAVNSTTDNKKGDNEIEERTRRNLELLEKCHKLTNKLTTSMAKSDQGFTTWSKLKKHTGQSPLRRHGSGNNNEESREANEEDEVNSSVIKSQSLPNLFRSRKLATSSLHSTALSNSTIDSFTHTTHQRLSGAVACMKVYDVAHNANCITRSHGSQHSEPMSTSSTENQSSSDKGQTKPFNLVKLFMKQKSMSNEGIVSMDQLERSECWPSSSGGESDSFGADSKTKHMRKIEKLPKMSISEDGSGQDETDFTIPTQTPGIYEPNILNTTQTLTCNRVYEATLIEEEENSETGNIENVDNRVLSDSESNLYATVNKPQARRNVNNNNSPLRVRNVNRRSCSSQSSATSVSISSCSESDGTQMTRMHRLIHKDHCDNRATSTQVQVETVDRSMQTSSIGTSYNSNYRDIVRVVEPSFLQKLKEGDCQKPVYVLYPNYTLPDISFLNGRPNIYLNPQKITLTSNSKKSRNAENKGKRPFSCNDLELLRKRGFGHIRDWDSLNFLLPNECRQMLSEVPEIMHIVSKESPHGRDKYCGIAPSPKSKSRPMSCDCNNLTGHHPTNVSSSSSTATQPSSGYRGSSTMLTDSSAQNSPAPGNFNPLFVYRYDSATSSEASYVDKINPTIPKRSLSLADQQRLVKGPEVAPPRPPLPKGILRKSIDKVRKSGASAKRYSMFEMEEFIQDPITCVTAVTEQKTAKRRSLQEPYYLQKHNSEERRKNNDVAAKRLSQQFLDAADKDAEYHEYYHDEGVGTESSLESGKSNDVKYHRPQTPPLPKPRTKKLEYIEFPPPGALISSLELQQLEEFLEQSGFSCDNMDEWDQNQVQKVRKQVNKFFNMKRSKEESANSIDSSGSKKSVSFAGKGEQKKVEVKPVEELKQGTTTPPNSPNISVLVGQRHYQGKNLAEIPICEEGETTPEEYGSPRRDLNTTRCGSFDISQKRALVSSVTDAVEMLIQHFSPATDQAELAILGDSSQSPTCAKIAINALCPALYAIFRDGLKENIETSFGAVSNSVWQMVEATARQGPITRALNELVMKINSEDAVTEGLVKFNAFILGLLNSQSVDAWVSYMRTRESALHKHYEPESLLRLGCSGEPSCRALLDTLVASLEPLKLLPFRLHLMFEMRELHRSFKRIESEVRAATRPTSFNAPSLTLNQRNLLKLVRSLHSSCSDRDEVLSSVIMRPKEPKEPSTPDLLNDSANVKTTYERNRPRSCVNPTMKAHDECPNNSRIEVDQNRRWSGVQLGSKLMQAFDRLVLCDSDDYTDSLENNKGQRASNEAKLDWSGDETAAGSRPPSGAGSNQSNGGKFRRLQLKWELLSNGDSSPSTPPGVSETSPASSRGSRIPRPVTSPVRPPAPASSPAKPSPHQRGIPVAVRKGSSPTTPVPRQPLASTPKRQSIPSRASRVEQPGGATPRPSSLPYGRTTSAATTTRRRAASSSLSRTDRSPTAAAKKNKPKMVRTLWHRLPSDSGHLAFSEGERLRLVLEVDDQYLLCCRGEHKGLVPRDAVILENSLGRL